MGPIRPLLLPAGLVLGSAAGLAGLGDLVASYPWTVALVALATGGWWLGVRRAVRIAATRSGVVFVLATAAAARLFLLVPGELSDDLYRYLWDGRVGNAGVHPFAHAPSAAELEPLRDDRIWPRVNHPDVPTIYPPVAQAYFRVLDRVAPSPLGARAASAAIDLLVVALLAALLAARGRSAMGAVVAGWCPLAILETAAGGHVDVLGSALLAGAWIALERRSRLASVAGGWLIALSALVKPFGVLLAPALLGPRSRGRAALLVGAAAGTLVAVPWLTAGVDLFAGMRAYAEHWHFNDCFYSLLVEGGLGPRTARAILAVVLVLTALLVPLRVRDPVAAAGCVVGAALVLSPTVHPWYALWLVPLLPFLPRAVKPAGFALAGLLPLAYAAAWVRLETGEWSEPVWARVAIWVPVLGLLAHGLFRHRARR